MPFMQGRNRGWVYHDVVRAQMLRYRRQESPCEWSTLHGKLATYYEGLRDALGLEGEIARRDEEWQEYTLEALYHRLCQDPRAHLTAALKGFLSALRAALSFADQWANMVVQARQDAGAEALGQWERRLVTELQAFRGKHYARIVETVTFLLEKAALDENERAWAIASRGLAYQLMGSYEKALVDFDQAMKLYGSYAWAMAHRGLTCRLMGRYEEALAEFDRAIEADEQVMKNKWLLNERGLVLSNLERYEEAAECFSQAQGATPDHCLCYNIAVATARWKGVLEARAEIDVARALLESSASSRSRGAILYGLAGLCALEGEAEEGLDCLSQAVQLEAQAAAWARHDTAWIDLRQDRRFQALVQAPEAES
jgi:tetratricopeptide (TPR) repeat protein